MSKVGLRSIAIAAIIAALSASGAAAQGKGETVRIHDYPGVGNMLHRVAISKGYCEKYGIKCQLQVIPSGPLGAQALLAKSVDVAFLPPEVQINAMIKGAQLKAVHGGAVLNAMQIVVMKDFPTPSAEKGYQGTVQDLKGKKIGVTARAGSLELQFVQMAQKSGLKADDFTFVAVGGPNTAFGALSSKQVDANVTFEPSGSICLVTGACKILFRGDLAKEPVEIAGTNGAGSNMVVTQETIDKTPHVVDALIAAAKDAEAFIQDPKNFDEVFKIAQSYFKFDIPKGDEILTSSLKIAIPAYKTAISRPALKQIADNMLATKMIEAAFDPAQLPYAKAP